MSNEILSAQPKPEITKYDELKKVEFLGDKRAEILEALNSKRPNYTKIAETLKEINSPEITAEAFNSKKTGGPLFFVYSAEKYMPKYMDEKHRPIEIKSSGIQEYLAQKTIQDHPDTENSLEDYKNAIKDAQNLWLQGYRTISREDRESWRETLCVNALYESAGADTREALKIIMALNRGVDVTKPERQKIDLTPGQESVTIYGEKGHFDYMVNDEKVRAIVLRYGGQKGLDFYQEIIGDHPSKTEQIILAKELARRVTHKKKYDEIPEAKYKQVEDIVTGYYEKKAKS